MCSCCVVNRTKTIICPNTTKLYFIMSQYMCWSIYAIITFTCGIQNLLCVYIYIYSVGPLYIWGRDSVVGIETRGWTVLEGTRPDRPGAHPASYTMGTGSFPGVKRPGRGVDHPLHLAPRLKKERVELYLYSPSGSSCSVLGWPLPLHVRISYSIWSIDKLWTWKWT